jgi:predicted nucleic acid-binding protein
MLTDFLAMPGIELVTNVNINTILSYWPDHIHDYGDAVVAAQCKNTPTTTVATFDRKFRNELATLGLPVFEL